MSTAAHVFHHAAAHAIHRAAAHAIHRAAAHAIHRAVNFLFDCSGNQIFHRMENSVPRRAEARAAEAVGFADGAYDVCRELAAGRGGLKLAAYQTCAAPASLAGE